MSEPAPHSDAAPFPRRIVLSEDRTRLRLEWADGSSQHLSAGLLRAHCRSSAAVRERVDGMTGGGEGTLSITALDLVGAYAVNISFSDGHDRGIYPWSYLRDIGEPDA